MGFTWNSSNLAALADPHFIDKLGHYVHGHQTDNYTFSMNVMGYQAMYYTAEFEQIVKKDSFNCGQNAIFKKMTILFFLTTRFKT